MDWWDEIVERTCFTKGKPMDIVILSRGEAVRLGDKIVVRLLDSSTFRGQVRLGIEAPRDVPIYRAELLQRSEKPYANREQADREADHEQPDADLQA